MASVNHGDDASRHEAAGTRGVARGGMANLVGAAYSGIASFATTAVITRIAPAEDAGIYFSAVSVLLIAIALVELGVPVGYVYFLSRYRSLGRYDALRRILTAGIVPMIGLSVVAVTLGVLFREPLGTMLFGPAVDGRVAIVLILCLGILAGVLADSALGATRGLGVMRPTVIADKFANPTVQLLALIALAAVGWTAGQQLVWTRVLGFAVVAGIGVPWLIRLLRRIGPRDAESPRHAWRPPRETYREFWMFTGPRSVGQIAQVAIQRVDIILVALWLSPAEAAVYAAATRFLIFGQLAAAAIGTAAQPRISALAARREMATLQDLYRTSTAWVVLATWPLYLTFIVAAETLMHVFGRQYSSGAPILQLLSGAMLLATACGAVDAVLLMAGKSTWTMVNAWVALAINVVLNIWLIPQLGIIGAALAWVAAICANNLIPLVQAWRRLGVHPFGRITMLAMSVPAVLFGMVPWVVQMAGGGLVGAAITLAVSACVYVVILWRWRRVLGLVGLLRRPKR